MPSFLSGPQGSSRRAETNAVASSAAEWFRANFEAQGEQLSFIEWTLSAAPDDLALGESAQVVSEYRRAAARFLSELSNPETGVQPIVAEEGAHMLMRLVRSETPGIRRLIVESVVPSSDLCASILFEIVGASEEEPSLRRVAAASLNTMIDRPAIVGAAIDRMEREFDKGAPDYDTVAAYARCLKRLRSRTGDHGSIRRLQAMMCFPMNEAAIQAVLEALC